MNRLENYQFILFKDNVQLEKITPSRQTFQNNLFVFELTLNSNFEFGHEYSLFVSEFPMVSIDVSSATEFASFDEDFYYDGNDLGSTYSKEETNFVLWAPLASNVELKIEENEYSLI